MTLTPLDGRRVATAFDRAAARYDEHAVLQQEVERRLLDRLQYFVQEMAFQPQTVLDLGCGTGSGSLALQQAFPDAQIVSFDISPNMLRRAGDRRGATALVCGDMHQLPFAPRSFDLVFCSLAVQWSAEEPRLFNALRRVLAPGGLFLFTSLGPDTLHELRSAWAAVDEQPHVNQFIDMHNVGDALVKAGFVDPVMDMELIVLEYRKVMDLMRDLKAIGAGNAAQDRAAGLTGRQRLQRVMDAYEAFKRDDRYPASYEVVYGATFGPQEGQPMRTAEGEVATFSLDALRAGRGKGGPDR